MLKILICTVLFLTAKCESWQAMGNFTSDNLTDIENILSAAFKDVLLGTNTINGLPKIISTQLNTKWDPAWNVIVAKFNDKTSNGVVYGYAFNNHWIWFNNKYDSSVSVIIWKDYNCHMWVDFERTTSNTFASTIVTALDSRLQDLMFNKPSYYQDIWRVAYESSAALPLLKIAYSMVFSTIVLENPIEFFGRFCTATIALQSQFFSTKITKDSGFGLNVIILGTRAIVA